MGLASHQSILAQQVISTTYLYFGKLISRWLNICDSSVFNVTAHVLKWRFFYMTLICRRNINKHQTPSSLCHTAFSYNDGLDINFMFENQLMALIVNVSMKYNFVIDTKLSCLIYFVLSYGHLKWVKPLCGYT